MIPIILKQKVLKFVPTIENGEKLCIRLCFRFFLFVFLAKSGTTKNNHTGLSDISY